MTESLAEKIWKDVSERVGDDLRAVTRYDGMEFEMELRDDVRAKYKMEEDRALVDDMIINQLSLDRTEEAFNAGRLEGIIHTFEDAWIVQWPDELKTKSGVLISIQRHGATASLVDVEWCLQYLDETVAPLIGNEP